MDFRAFSRALLADALFYDAEYGLYGSISLIDFDLGREVYIAAYDPRDEVFQIEKATDWETRESTSEDEFGYAIASDGEIVGRYPTNLETADALLVLAEEEGGLVPGFVPEIEED
jgi:hypothetical protein